jgi:hypothetical protein
METEKFSPAVRLKKRKRDKEKKIWFYAHFSACKSLGYTGKALGYTRPNVAPALAVTFSISYQKISFYFTHFSLT